MPELPILRVRFRRRVRIDHHKGISFVGSQAATADKRLPCTMGRNDHGGETNTRLIMSVVCSEVIAKVGFFVVRPLDRERE